MQVTQVVSKDNRVFELVRSQHNPDKPDLSVQTNGPAPIWVRVDQGEWDLTNFRSVQHGVQVLTNWSSVDRLDG